MELNKIYQGDVLDVLRTFPNESVHCCVTSPPYWGLRDYQTAKWRDGMVDCDHLGPPRGGRNPATAKMQLTNCGTLAYQYSDECKKCGAKRVDKQLGLEKTLEEYVAKMVEVFREVKRVLRDDGTLWLNLGDSYIGSMKGYSVNGNGYGGPKQKTNVGSMGLSLTKNIPGLKPKDLVGIPWRVAFALQADGWHLRSDIIWHKNPMPESVQDRPTKSHEYIFLMSKSPRYYYDIEAIKEPAKDSSVQRLSQNLNGQNGSGRVPGKTNGNMKAVCGGLKGFKKSMAGGGTSFNGHRGRFDKNGKEIYGLKVNKRSVWYVTKQPFREAHFATFPPKLIEPCIKAGSPQGGVVLDPFMGAGTTGLVAKRLGRNYVGIELNASYIEIANRRIQAEISKKDAQPELFSITS